MKKVNYLKLAIAITVVSIFVSCSKNGENKSTQPTQQKAATDGVMSENGDNPDEAAMTTQNASLAATNSISENRDRNAHFLYTESNEAGNNKILIYAIGRDGSLQLTGATASGGAGTGKGLGSQAALVLDKNHEWLFAVNAGSNSVSSFKVNDDGSLTLAHTESSGGATPISASTNGKLLYVLNFGSDNIQGFSIGEDGSLAAIEGSAQSLSGAGVNAPQISFTPNGDWVIVTEKATNNISSFKVKHNGSVWPGIVTASTGATPFGFEFARDRFMVVSNAAGGAAGAGSATSYTIGNNGNPQQINGAVPNHEAAPCWVAITQYGRFAFLTNTASNSISSYYINAEGRLFLAHQVAASTNDGPLDIVVAKNNYYVYTLNGKSGTIGEYHRTPLGGLESIGSVSALPAPATGLATY